MNQPLLSVIIPAKDQAPFIRDAMTSLTRQFDDPSVMEIIVIDDGSTDGTGELAAAFTGRLPGLQIHRNDTAQGVASARNLGLDRAAGRYITFLDPDDWYAPGHLAGITAEIAQLKVDFLRVDHIRHTGGERTVHKAPQALRHVPLNPRDGIAPYDRSTMVDYCFPPFGIFDAKLKDDGLLHFPAGRRTAEDRPWVWQLHLKASTYAVSDQLGAFYRRGIASSLTQIFDDRQLDFVLSYQEIFQMVAADREAEKFWAKAARQFLAIACHQLLRSDDMSARYRARLHDGIRQTLPMLPLDVACTALRTLDAKRRDLLAPMIGSLK